MDYAKKKTTNYINLKSKWFQLKINPRPKQKDIASDFAFFGQK